MKVIFHIPDNATALNLSYVTEQNGVVNIENVVVDSAELGESETVIKVITSPEIMNRKDRIEYLQSNSFKRKLDKTYEKAKTKISCNS